MLYHLLVEKAEARKINPVLSYVIYLSLFLSAFCCLDGDFSQSKKNDHFFVTCNDDDLDSNIVVSSSCCKKPKQGPPGPALGNYITAFYFGTAQFITAPNVLTPLHLNNIRISDGWVLTGETDFTNTQSGIYLVSYTVGMFSENTDSVETHVSFFQNGVEFDEGHSFAVFSTSMLGILSSTFLVSYTAGDVLQFFFDASLSSVNMGGNAVVTITRIQ